MLLRYDGSLSTCTVIIYSSHKEKWAVAAGEDMMLWHKKWDHIQI